MEFAQNSSQRNGLPQWPVTNLVLDDLTRGLNEWRNIQDIVRLTFKAFHDVLKSQGEAIKALERTVDTKAGKSEVAAALQQKANVNDTAARVREIESMLTSKADIADMERRALKTEVEASLRTQVSDIYSVLRTKANDSELKNLKEAAEKQLAALKSDTLRLAKGLEDTRAVLDTKAGAVEVSQALSQKADVAAVEERLKDKVGRKAFSEALSLKSDQNHIDQLEQSIRHDLADLMSALGRKAEQTALEEVGSRTERLRQRMEADSETTAAALRTISATFDSTIADVRGRLEGSATQLAALGRGAAALEQALHDVETATREQLGKKVDAVEVYRLLDKKADLAAVNEALSHKANEDLVAQLLARVDADLDLAGKVEALQRDVAHKISADKGVYSVLEGLAKVDDVNKALLEVCAELETKAPQGDVTRMERQQAAINSSFAQNLHVARWLWKSGRVKAGGLVPWNVQAVNSAPENYLWEEDKSTVIVVAPGLYEVSFAFFNGAGKRRPIVRLQVQGEIIATATKPQPAANGGASGGTAGTVISSQVHSAIGLSYFDVLSLPPKAKLAIVYEGEDRGEGFLMLRKL